MRLARTLDTVVKTRVRWKFRPGDRPQIARQARKELVELGPTFVKIGQYVSTRSDIFPEELVKEFATLQDNVQGFELPRDLEIPELTNVSPKPIAAASLGQVHTCRYKGKDCVVKVLRPQIKEQVEGDIQNLLLLTKLFEIVNPVGSRDLTLFVHELETMLKMETNYILEAKNTRNFRKNFQDVDWVIVPRVFHATENVLVMEYVPSKKITEVKGFNKKSLAWAITKSQIMQVLSTGFFHGDPHPGNVGVSRDGKLVYYDFGMVSEISVTQKKTLLALLFAVTNENEEQILAIISNLGLVSSDPTGLRTFVRFSLDYIKKNDPKSEDIEELLAINNNPIKLSGSFFYLIRSFGLIEGICKELDPNYSNGVLLARYVDESDTLENAMLLSVQNTFNDMTGVSYRLSNIEKRVKKSQKESVSDRNLLLLVIILLYLAENDWVALLVGQ